MVNKKNPVSILSNMGNNGQSYQWQVAKVKQYKGVAATKAAKISQLINYQPANP